MFGYVEIEVCRVMSLKMFDSLAQRIVSRLEHERLFELVRTFSRLLHCGLS